jgi:hypothetical protein
VNGYSYEVAILLNDPRQWTEAGFDDADRARQWWEAGFDPSDSTAWIGAAKYVIEAHELPAASPDDLLEVARTWRVAGFTPAEARGWRDVLRDWDDMGTLVHEARRWRAAGFDPDSAGRWLQSGLDAAQDLEFAILFSNAGWSPPEAALLSLLSRDAHRGDWDDRRRRWIALGSPRTLDYVKAGFTPEEAEEREKQNPAPETLTAELTSRCAELPPLDAFRAMHVNHVVFLLRGDDPEDADLPFWAQHVWDLHDEDRTRASSERDVSARLADSDDVGEDGAASATVASSRDRPSATLCPGSGGPGRLEFQDGMEDWYVHCPICGTTWMGGSGSELDAHWPPGGRP